jgi:hypothetical protein
MTIETFVTACTNSLNISPPSNPCFGPTLFDSYCLAAASAQKARNVSDDLVIVLVLMLLILLMTVVDFADVVITLLVVMTLLMVLTYWCGVDFIGVVLTLLVWC